MSTQGYRDGDLFSDPARRRGPANRRLRLTIPARQDAWTIAVAIIALYSLSLLTLEFRTSQEGVRPYFTDIAGDVRFYAVNTTLASTFLFGAAGFFLFAAAAPSRPRDQRLLYGIQGALLLYTGFDDRFSFHEALSTTLRVGDGWIMLTLTAINVAAYLMLFKPAYFNVRMTVALVLAAGLFFAMMVFDTLLPEAMRMRLSFEDLCKTWAAFFLFKLAWETAEFSRSPSPVGLQLPDRLISFAPRRWREDDQ